MEKLILDQQSISPPLFPAMAFSPFLLQFVESSKLWVNLVGWSIRRSFNLLLRSSEIKQSRQLDFHSTFSVHGVKVVKNKNETTVERGNSNSDNSNSGSCNSSRMPSHLLFLLHNIHVKTLPYLGDL